MYAFIDQPVSALSAGEKFLLSAMRLWTATHLARRCPASAMMGSFAEAGAQGALRHFNMAMMLLAHDGRRELGLSPSHYCRVGEDEAVLLALWRSMAQGDEAVAHGTLALLVSEGMFVPASRAFDHSVAALANAGIDLRATPGDRQEAGQ